MKTKIAIIMIFIIHSALYCQESGCRQVIRGQVIDSGHTEPLSLAEVQVVGQKNKNSGTNSKGEFEITGLCRGKTELHVSHQQCEHIHLLVDVYNDTFITIYLKHIEHEFEGVKLSVKGEKWEGQHIMQARQLESRKGFSIAGMMEGIGGISLLKTGSNVSKPVVNGLHGNRVIIINNGIRQEGQNWGMDHAPEVDAFLASEIELVRGAEALRYAADGIGGVILVRPASIFREKSRLLKAEINAVSSSNGRTGIVSGFIGSRVSDKFPLFWRIQGTMKQGGNVHAPDYFLANTGMSEKNYSLNLGYKLNAWKSEIFYSHFMNRNGIFSGAHIGSLSDLQKAIESERPLISSGFTYGIDRPYQLVTHRALKLKNEYQVTARDLVELNLSYQHNHRSEFDLLRSSASFQGPSFDYYLHTYNGNLTWIRSDFHKLNFKGGLNGTHQFNTYTGRFFIPAYFQNGLASYFIASRAYNKINFEAAVRYDVSLLKAFLWRSNNLNVKMMNFHGFTYALQASGKINETSKITFSHTSSWRPPSPNELFSDGLHQGLASIEKGDSSMRPERSFNQGLVYNLQKKSLELEAEAYYKYIRGFINLIPSLTPQLTIRGAFPVFLYQQNDAEIFGLNFTVKKEFRHNLFAKTSGSLLFGNNLSAGQPLSQMPPISGISTFGYDNSRMTLQAFVRYTASQYRYVAGSDYKAPPKAYYLLGLDAAFRFMLRQQPLNLSLSISNLTDKRYREYLNRFRYFTDEQGFNLTIRLTIPLDIKLKTNKHHEH